MTLRLLDVIDIGAMRRPELVPTEPAPTRWRSTGSVTSSTHFYSTPIERHYFKAMPERRASALILETSAEDECAIRTSVHGSHGARSL
jgi:hypothetical protein